MIKTTKICEICGDDYEGTANQKYCPICGKNPDRMRKRYERAQKKVCEHMGVYDEPKKKVCEYCKKEFSTYGDSSFCSKECKKRYRIENATCTFCHRNLLSLGIEYYSETGGARFCSEECKKSWYEYLKLHSNTPVHEKTCPQCNQTFTGKNTRFCSKKCYEDAKASGWKPDSQKMIEAVCKHCNKTFMTPFMYPSRYCPDCTFLLYKIQKKKSDAAKKAAKKKQEEEKRRADIEKNGLCFYCQTTYFNCEKMRSNFRYYPKGAVVEQGKVVKCPSYTDKNTSKKK